MKSIKTALRKFRRDFNQNRPPFRRKVFGIGYPKTGTTTLGYCLRYLGYKHTTFDPNLTVQVRRGNTCAAFAKARRYEAFEDWPWFLIYEELFHAFPKAKFILTVRQDPQTYINSLRRFREKKQIYSGQFNEPWWWREAIGYAPDYWNAEQMMSDYVSHNENVIAFFKPYPDRLAKLCWEQGDQWEDLCRFINKPAPKIAFPHLNVSAHPKPEGPNSDKIYPANRL